MQCSHCVTFLGKFWLLRGNSLGLTDTCGLQTPKHLWGVRVWVCVYRITNMFLIDFSLGFQNVTESLQTIVIAEMKEKGINLSKFWQERSGCFQDPFSFAISCPLVPKNSSSAMLFHFIGMF